eukprot:comp12104_c1_seq1/m.6838 comp12104_c1_seq1/g.6838  ORF comp12104_c1_seq1/g.6838 comp12104_c1_seq1/m.6838 type:complete len:117 (-) comp12104_c1_seq1:136-486(-)
MSRYTGRNNGYRPLGSNDDPAGHDMHERAMEQNNDQMILDLSQKVADLRTISEGIHGEVNNQNTFLDGLSMDFSNAEGVLGTSMNKLKELTKRKGGTMYLVGFCLLLFIVIYWLVK